MDVCAIRDALAQGLRPGQHVTVWLFGSRARGTHRRFSDVDLLIESRPPFCAAQRDAIADALQASEIPYVVDLVPIEALHTPYAARVLGERRLLLEVSCDGAAGHALI